MQFAIPILCAVSALWLCGCSQAPEPGQAAAAAAPTPLNWVTPLQSAAAESAETNAATLQLVVHQTIVPEGSVEFLGLTNLFIMQSKPDDLFASSEVVGFGRAFTNAVVKTNVFSAGFGTGTTGGFSNFLATATNVGGFELLSSNAITLNQRSEGLLSLSSIFTFVAEEKSSPTVPGGTYPFTTNLSLQTSLRIFSRGHSTNVAALFLQGLVEDLRGYKVNPAKKPQPSFEVSGWNGEFNLVPDQVAVVSSGPYENIVQYSSSLPYLSSVPLFGKYFTERGTQTNRYYRVYFLRYSN